MTSDRGWSREWLESVRAYVSYAKRERRIMEARRERRWSLGSQAPSDGGHSGKGPRNAIYEDVVAWLQAQEDSTTACRAACEEIRQAHDVLSGMALAGPREAECSQVLTCVYLDGMSEREASLVLHMSKTTVRELEGQGLDWLDAMGPERARQGVGIATD